MIDQYIKRPALGQAASLGSLYDARDDTVLALSLLNKAPFPDAVTTIDIPSSDIRYCESDSYNAKFRNLDIDGNLSGSLLAGFLKVSGAANYLNEKRDSNLCVQRSLIYNITTVSQSINFLGRGMETCLNYDLLATRSATHVVAGIAWGSRNVVEVKKMAKTDDDANKIGAELKLEVNFVIDKIKGGGSGNVESETQGHKSSLDVTVHGDMRANDGLMPTSLETAVQFLINMPKYIESANNGRGVPLIYTLMPLTELSTLLRPQIKRNLIANELSAQCAEKFVQIFDELSYMQKNLHDYQSLVRHHHDYVPKRHLHQVNTCIHDARTLETHLRGKYAEGLSEVRSGGLDTNLWSLADDFSGRLKSPDLSLKDSYVQKIKFVTKMVEKGAIYVGYNDESLDSLLNDKIKLETYVFHFSEEVRKRRNSEAWLENFALLSELLTNTNVNIILYDCDALEEPTQRPSIKHYTKGQLMCKDVVQDGKASASMCFARFEPLYKDNSGHPAPQSRIPIISICPGNGCGSKAKHEWVCYQCKDRIEFGVIDTHIYCSCGRCNYQHWEFRCSDPKHGLAFSKFNDNGRLLKILHRLDPFQELNILILGPTGVGKSTWINAFVNYLIHPSLDDALAAPKLQYIISFGFSHTVPDSDQEEFKVEHINYQRVGDRSGRQNGQGNASGESDTQETTVHTFEVGKLRVRLFDTPGIGDTRGVPQDRKNMADILGTLRSYDKLHGILILLKPNETRLTAAFNFCIKELLVHLHRDAARNIAFGFTNSRSTGYQPGDSLTPLRRLLADAKDKIDLAIRPRNTFCFDSESFRYLAAMKAGVDLGHLDENRASWKHSVQESQRVLKYFEHDVLPHRVHSTTSLYSIRCRAADLAKPMSLISETIRGNVMVNRREVDHLNNCKQYGSELRSKLSIKKTSVRLRQVDQPYTVCGASECIDRTDSGQRGQDGKPVYVTLYRRPCHSPCYLTNITIDDPGHQGLRSCAAINSNTGNCYHCSHQWRQHLHINLVPEKYEEDADDPGVLSSLKNNESKRKTIELGIAAKEQYIRELTGELEQTSKIAAKMSIFLEQNAIMPYNDKMLDYLDTQIKNENEAVRAGGSRDRLDKMLDEKKEYTEQIKTFQEHIMSGSHEEITAAAVEKMFTELCNLKHNGSQLRDMLAAMNDAASKMMHREKQSGFQAKSHFTNHHNMDPSLHPRVLDASKSTPKRAWYNFLQY